MKKLKGLLLINLMVLSGAQAQVDSLELDEKPKEISLELQLGDSLKQPKDSTNKEKRISIGTLDLVYRDGESDTIEFKSNKSPQFKLAFDIGVASYRFSNAPARYTLAGKFATKQNDNRSLDLGRSRSISLSGLTNFTFTNNIGSAIGFSFTWNNYAFTNNVTIQKDGSFSAEDSIQFTKFRLKTTYLKVPLYLTCFSKNRDWEFGIGPYAGVRIGSRLVAKYSLTGKENKTVTKDDFNLRPFTYGLSMRLTYKNIGLFAEASAEPLFIGNPGNNGSLYPISFGIAIGGI